MTAFGAVLISQQLACDRGSAGETASLTAIRDSAGVRIVEHSIGSLPPSAIVNWRIADDVELSIGGQDTDVDEDFLYLITGAQLLDDGRIIVGVGGEFELRLYDSNGRLVRTVGRRGSGPGEFRQISGPWLVDGGRFAVFDQRQQRLSVFDTTGVLLGSANMRGEAGMVPARALDGAPDGRVLIVSDLMSGMQAGVSRPEITYMLLDTIAAVRLLTSPLLGREMWVGRADAAGRQALGVPPFGRTSLAKTCGSRVAIAENSSFDIQLLDADGRVQTVIRADAMGEPVTEMHFREFLTTQTGGRIPITSEMISSIREMTVHERMPVLGEMYCDPGGNLWIEEFLIPGKEERRLLSFGVDGQLRGALELSASSRIAAIVGDRLLLINRNVEDIESIELRAIVMQ